MPSNGFQEQSSFQLLLSRPLQFWVQAAHVYTSYEVASFWTAIVKDGEKREVMWEQQHEAGAEKMYSLCVELSGLFLKGIIFFYI